MKMIELMNPKRQKIQIYEGAVWIWEVFHTMTSMAMPKPPATTNS